MAKKEYKKRYEPDRIFNIHDLACQLVDVTRDLNHVGYCGNREKDEAKLDVVLTKLSQSRL